MPITDGGNWGKASEDPCEAFLAQRDMRQAVVTQQAQIDHPFSLLMANVSHMT